MTDLDKFIELYRSVGVEPEIHRGFGQTTLRLEAQTQPKIEGYYGHETIITFNGDGKFLGQSFFG
jgi:hypothetical protein